VLLAVRLDGFREDAVDILSVVVGRQKASRFITGMESHIRQEARAGAEKAIPTIKSEVRAEATSAVKPLVIGSIVVSGLAILGTGYLFLRRR
jgi:hypothetical protein